MRLLMQKVKARPAGTSIELGILRERKHRTAPGLESHAPSRFALDKSHRTKACKADRRSLLQTGQSIYYWCKIDENRCTMYCVASGQK